MPVDRVLLSFLSFNFCMRMFSIDALVISLVFHQMHSSAFDAVLETKPKSRLSRHAHMSAFLSQAEECFLAFV